MRKDQIRPGVVYAYQGAKHRPVTPIVFLVSPADGILYERRSIRDHGSPEPRYARAADGAKPVSGRGSLLARTVGYPVATLGTNGDPKDLPKATLAGFEAATGVSRGEFAYHLETRLASIIGLWDEVTAAEAEKQARRDKMAADLDAAEKASQSRAASIVAALAQAGPGFKAEPDQRYGVVNYLRISLDEAEKLAALLNREAGE
jgi:hypothetical protein